MAVDAMTCFINAGYSQSTKQSNKALKLKDSLLGGAVVA